MTECSCTGVIRNQRGACVGKQAGMKIGRSAGSTVEIDIHGEDYVPSAVPPAEVLAANKPKKPAREGKLHRQKAKAPGSPSAAALSDHSDAHMEVVPSALPSSSGAKPKSGKEWSDIDLSSPQP